MEHKDNAFDSTNVFVFFLRWWLHLVIICAAAAIAAVIFSSPRFITPKFQSTVTMFPATTGSLSRSVFVGTDPDFLAYGEVEEAERLLQILESANMRERIVARFGLHTHYGIPEGARYSKTYMIDEYRSNIKFRRTQFGAVEIRVRDRNPVMAADIANELATLADTLQNDLLRERAKLAYKVARTQYETLLAKKEEAKNSLRHIMSMGVSNPEYQVQMLTRQLAIDLSSSNKDGVDVLKENLDMLADHGGSFVFNENYLVHASNQLIAVEDRYLQAKIDKENVVPFHFILDTAFEADRKVYPVRWLIVFLTTFAAGFMGVVILMVYENLVEKGIIKEKAPKTSKS